MVYQPYITLSAWTVDPAVWITPLLLCVLTPYSEYRDHSRTEGGRRFHLPTAFWLLTVGWSKSVLHQQCHHPSTPRHLRSSSSHAVRAMVWVPASHASISPYSPPAFQARHFPRRSLTLWRIQGQGSGAWRSATRDLSDLRGIYPWSEKQAPGGGEGLGWLPVVYLLDIMGWFTFDINLDLSREIKTHLFHVSWVKRDCPFRLAHGEHPPEQHDSLYKTCPNGDILKGKPNQAIGQVRQNSNFLSVWSTDHIL